eukprot:scaffold131_cov154-Amphora_coffeaeformis.AAC.3
MAHRSEEIWFIMVADLPPFSSERWASIPIRPMIWPAYRSSTVSKIMINLSQKSHYSPDLAYVACLDRVFGLNLGEVAWGVRFFQEI